MPPIKKRQSFSLYLFSQKIHDFIHAVQLFNARGVLTASSGVSSIPVLAVGGGGGTGCCLAGGGGSGRIATSTFNVTAGAYYSGLVSNGGAGANTGAGSQGSYTTIANLTTTADGGNINENGEAGQREIGRLCGGQSESGENGGGMAALKVSVPPRGNWPGF